MLSIQSIRRLSFTAIAVMLVSSVAIAQQPDAKSRPAVAIGTYDSRAVAIAYGRSEFVQRAVNELRQQYERAKADGDQNRAEILQKQGASRQIRMHLQAFSNAPVDDALAAVRDRIPQVAEQMHVAAIVSTSDYNDGSVELVDVTDELVKLYNPTAETLRMIEDCRKQKPAAIEEIARIPARN